MDINGRRISLDDGVAPKNRIITETELACEYQVGIYQIKQQLVWTSSRNQFLLTSLTTFAMIDDFPVPDSPSKTQGELFVDVI